MRFLSGKKVNADKIWDLLGVVAIFGLMVAGFWIAHGLDVPTGADQLMGVV